MLRRYLTSKWLMLSFALIAGALGLRPSMLRLVGIGSSTSSGTSSYVTAPTERRDIREVVTAAGTLKPVSEVKVGSQVSGQIKELYADFNSSVVRGQVIARIDPETFEAKVAQAQAELEMAQTLIPVQRAEIGRYSAERDNARSTLAAAAARTARAVLALDESNRQLTRTRQLAAKGVASASALEQAENNRASAEAQVEAAHAEEQSKQASCRAADASLQMAQAQLANDQAQVRQKQALLRQAQFDLDHTYIRAPVTGTVVDRSVDRGQTVAASLSAPTIFTIAQDLKQMQVEAAVVEADVRRFVVGQPVTFTVDTYSGRVFKGKVVQIRKAAKSVHNVVTYTVVIAADNPDQMLLPGMTANLRVVVARRHDVISVPNAALRFHLPQQAAGGSAYAARYDETPDIGRVFVLNAAGDPVPLPLRLGITDGRMTEVLGGNVPVGTRVITGKAETSSADDKPAGLINFRLR